MNRLKKISNILICSIVIIALFPVAAGADTGPKPSVRVNFLNMGDELCYATLLSKKDSTGPNSVWDGDEEHIYNYDLDIEIWRAFAEYQDADGFYFLQIGWKVSETKEIAWTYYPPDTFKILLYYPERDAFVVSGICEKYAFDTYYTVDMEGVDIGSVDYNEELSNDDRLNAYRSYNYKQEIIALIIRIFITIVIEMCIALLFGFKGVKQLLFLACVNTATQIILNVLLNVINYSSGHMAFTINYILFEFIVFALEAVLYCSFMDRFAKKPKKKTFYVIYALVANMVSFGAGLAIALVLPGIF